LGTVVQFAERLADGADWTPSERSQLRDMGAQLSAAAAGLDLVFGKTEEGDPWCVVADQESDVLLHIARIGGSFVVHAPANDQTAEGQDLWNAVSRVIGGVLQRRRGVILPFPPEAMGHQAVLALMVAAAVRGDFHDIIQGTLPGAPIGHDFTSASPAADVGRGVQGQIATAPQAETGEVWRLAPAVAAGAAPGQAVQATPHGAAQAQAQAGQAVAQAGPLDGAGHGQAVTPAEIQTAGRAALEALQLSTRPTNGSGAGSQTGGDKGAPPSVDHGFGAAGDGQAGAGPASTEGGKGESQNANPDASGQTGGGMGGDVAETHQVAVLADGPIARGATGAADNFVLTAPRTLGAGVAASSPPVSLGVVEGFTAAEGDRFVLSNGLAPTVTTVATLPEVSNAIPGAGPGANGTTVVISGHRYGFDLNGDGREDAFVVVLTANDGAPVLHQAANTAITSDAPVAPAGQADAGMTLLSVGVFIGH
jgi:hypothetical protein